MDVSPELHRKIRMAVARRLKEDGMDHDARRALKKVYEKLQQEDGVHEPPIFEVRPISNGFLVTYNDVEEFDVKVPVYDPPPSPSPGAAPIPRGSRVLGGPPRMESQKRWKLKRSEVYCAGAESIKAAVDEALRLEEKVKLLVAEGVLSGDGIGPGESFVAIA